MYISIYIYIYIYIFVFEYMYIGRLSDGARAAPPHADRAGRSHLRHVRRSERDE